MHTHHTTQNYTHTPENDVIAVCDGDPEALEEKVDEVGTAGRGPVTSGVARRQRETDDGEQANHISSYLSFQYLYIYLGIYLYLSIYLPSFLYIINCVHTRHKANTYPQINN